MPIVKFHSTEEFNEELRKEYSRETDIVRLTTEIRGTSHGVMRQLTVISTVRSTSHPDDIIRLDRYCGQLWGHGLADDKTNELAENTMKSIREVCKELVLEVRAGVLEQHDGQG